MPKTQTVRRRFSGKRNPYKIYKLAEWKWSDVFKEISAEQANLNANAIEKVSIKFGINKRTLYVRYHEWINAGSPSVWFRDLKEVRGGSNKTFTDDEEKQLADFIIKTFIDAHLPFDNEDCRLLAMNKWNTIHPDQKDVFKASDGWITNFKWKYKLSSVKPRKSHVTDQNKPEIKDEDKKFVEECLKEFVRVGENFFSIWMKHFGE